MSNPNPRETHIDGELCRVCGKPVQRAFEATLLGDIPVQYHRCVECGSFMLLHPHWLERAYALKIRPDPDFGALRRALFLDRSLRRLRSIGILPHDYKTLDYGSGSGLLVRLQRDRDIEAWGYDRYAIPQFAEQFCSLELPDGKFDLITCTEVLEHLVDPDETLRKLRARLTDKGILLVTTELYEPERYPDPRSWNYLALDHGQHITFFTAAGLKAVASSSGLSFATTIRWHGVPFLHLLTVSGQKISRAKLLRLALRHRLGEKRFQDDSKQ
jgi:hypothetical protein